MDKKLKKQWVKALRSGEYKQGKKTLYKINKQGEERFCCLGILADIAIDGDWILNEKTKFYTLNPSDKSSNLSHFLSPKHNFGLKEQISRFNYRTFQQELAKMNDRGKSFETIANWIEKNVPED